MFNRKKVIAIIPARGGSKRLPGKNIKEFCGRPLLEWSIDAAKQSKYIDLIAVSSDDNDTLSIAEKCNVKAIERPDFLANDKSTIVDVLLHALEGLKSTYDYLILLQPTSPLRTSMDIDRSIETLVEREANAIVSVCQAEHSPLWCNVLPADGSMEDFMPQSLEGVRSQDLEVFYRINGAVYVVKVGEFIKEKSLMPKATYAYKMDQSNSVDIDTIYDFIYAETLIREKG